MASKKLDVIIVGGSLGGLFTGIVLKRLGHRIRIFERNPTPLLHNQGAGIVAGGDTQTFFKLYDRTQTQLALTSEYRQYLNLAGDKIDKENWVQHMTSWDLAYNLLRANYDGLETEYCGVPETKASDGEATYQYGHTVTKIKEKGSSSVAVSFLNRDGVEDETTVDLLIGADGPSSSVRNMFDPSVERKYAGYLAWRGTAPENTLSEATTEALCGKFTFYHQEGTQALAYLIPGINGSKSPGERLMNFVLYQNYPEGSPELQEIMTGTDGQQHRVTIPPGKMKPEVWKKYKAYFATILPFQFADVINNTPEPFIQAVTDVRSSQATFLNGKVMLIGDALAGFRPHTAASTTQAAKNAMSVGQYLSGEMSLEEWEAESMEFAVRVQEHGIRLGDTSQFGGWRQLRKDEAQNK